MATLLTAHFTLEEAQRVSKRTITAAQQGKLLRLLSLVEPARQRLGFPIYITSYIRDSGSGSHKFGDAIDLGVAGNDRAKLALLFAELRKLGPRDFGKLIDERDHIHLTLPGTQGSYGEVWYEPVEGEYKPLPLLLLMPFGVGSEWNIVFWAACAALLFMSARKKG